MYWNADGIRSQIHDLLDLLLDLSIDILAVNETRLSTNALLNTPGYVCYRQDKHPNNGKGQGVALLIKSDLQHTRISIPITQTMESIGVRVILSGYEYSVIAAYQSPNSEISTSDLDILLKLGPRVLIMGDLNAKHTLWNCPSSNNRGKTLVNHMLDNDFIIHAPDSPTLVHYNPDNIPSTPDLCLVKNVTNISGLLTVPALSSNHLPVVFTLEGTPLRETMKLFNYPKADWTSFRSFLNEKIFLSAKVYDSITDLDDAVSDITNIISEARDRFVPKVKISDSPTPLPRFIKKLIRNKNRLRKHDQRETNPNVRRSLRTAMNNLQEQIKIAIQAHNDKTWNKKLSKVDNPSSDIWKLVRSLNRKSCVIPPLKNIDGSLTKDIHDQSNVLAETFHNNMLLTSSWVPSADTAGIVNRSVNLLSNYSPNDDPILHPIRPKELWKHVRSLKSRKSPGPDSITNILLKNLPQKGIVSLTKILNGCLRTCYYPSAWKLAKVIAIKKPGKEESDPVSYRPISLLSTLGKLYERLILSRLARYSDPHLLPEQFGFRRGHSTVQQLARVAENIADNHNKNSTTGMYLLDVEKAFDTVWHDGLAHKLIEIGVPLKLVKLVVSYLENRRFKVHIGITESDIYGVPAGVPQGSVLGPYLFLVYLNDIPKQPRTQLACFADDTAVFTSSEDIDLVISRLDMSLELLHEYFTKWKLKLNGSKTDAILFTRKRQIPTRQLTINGHKIPWKQSVKYLGIILDTKLNWTTQTKALHQKGIKSLCGLSQILNRRSNLSAYTKLRMYTTLIRPCITYAAPVWSSTCDSNFDKLQLVQNKALKTAFNTPFYTNLSKLHGKIQLPKIKPYVLNISRKFYIDKNPHHSNSLVSSIGKSRLHTLSYANTYKSYKLPHHYFLNSE